jgi:N-acetyl-beta-hexosaminidase
LTTNSNSNGTYLKSWNTPGSKHHAVEEADGDEELLIVRQAHPPLPQLLPGSASIFSKYHLLVKLLFIFQFLQVLRQTGACSSTSLSKIMHKGPKKPEYQFSMEGTDLTVTMEKEAIRVTIAANLESKAQFSKATRTVQAVFGQISCEKNYRQLVQEPCG